MALRFPWLGLGGEEEYRATAPMVLANSKTPAQGQKQVHASLLHRHLTHQLLQNSSYAHVRQLHDSSVTAGCCRHL